MFFNKNFKFDLEKGLTLINSIDRDNYLKNKIDHFSIYSNYSSKDERLNFLGEIIDMCDYDMNNATFDFSQMPPIQGINIYDLKPHMIYFYNLAVILGGVFLNVFDKNGNRIARVEDGKNGPINTNSMFIYAYNEFINCKNNKSTLPYGSTLIFATLFEKDIKERTKVIYAKQYLNLLKTEITTGNIVLTADENNLFDFLQYNYGMIDVRKTTVRFDGVKATTEMQYQLLKKYSITPHDENIEKLLCNKFTLTPLLRSSLFKDIADDRFQKIVSLVFEPSNLNLRNNLAHCNFTYMNYYSIYITALMFVLFTMVADESFLK